METVEKTGTIIYVDENGGLVNFYPATKASKVEGLDEHIAGTKFDVNVDTGMLEYTTVTNTTFEVNETSGELEYGARTVEGESTSYTIRKDSATGDMITEYSDGTKIVVHKNTDGSIIETTYKNNAVVKSVTTTRNADGSISVTQTSG